LLNSSLSGEKNVEFELKIKLNYPEKPVVTAAPSSVTSKSTTPATVTVGGVATLPPATTVSATSDARDSRDMKQTPTAHSQPKPIASMEAAVGIAKLSASPAIAAAAAAAAAPVVNSVAAAVVEAPKSTTITPEGVPVVLSNVTVPSIIPVPSAASLTLFREKLSNVYTCCKGSAWQGGIVSSLMNDVVKLFVESDCQLFLMYVLLLEPECGIASVSDYETNRPRIATKAKKGGNKGNDDDSLRKKTIASYKRLGQLISDEEVNEGEFRALLGELGEVSPLVKRLNGVMKIEHRELIDVLLSTRLI
jgi:hypothetical protein